MSRACTFSALPAGVSTVSCFEMQRCALLALALEGDAGTMLLRESIASFLLPGVDGVFLADCATPARGIRLADFLPLSEDGVVDPRIVARVVTCGDMPFDAAMNALRDAALAAGFTHALLARTHEQLVQLPLNQRVDALPLDWQSAHVFQAMSDVAWRPRADVLIALEVFVFVGALLPAPVPISTFRVGAIIARPWPSVAVAAETYTLDVPAALKFVVAAAAATRAPPPSTAHAHIASDVADFQFGLCLFQAGLFAEARGVFERRAAVARQPGARSHTALMDKLMVCRTRLEAAAETATDIGSLDAFYEAADAWLRCGCADGLVLLHIAAAKKQMACVSALALAAVLDTRLVPAAVYEPLTPFHSPDSNSFGAQLVLGATSLLGQPPFQAARTDAVIEHAQMLFARHHPASALSTHVQEQFRACAKPGDDMPLARQWCRAASIRDARARTPLMAVFASVVPDGVASAALLAAAAAPDGRLPPWEWLSAWVAHTVRAPALRWITGPVFVTVATAVRVQTTESADAQQFTLIIATEHSALLELFAPDAADADTAPESMLSLAPGSVYWAQRPHAPMRVSGACLVIAVMSALPPLLLPQPLYTTSVYFKQPQV